MTRRDKFTVALCLAIVLAGGNVMGRKIQQKHDQLEQMLAAGQVIASIALVNCGKWQASLSVHGDGTISANETDLGAAVAEFQALPESNRIVAQHCAQPGVSTGRWPN